MITIRCFTNIRFDAASERLVGYSEDDLTAMRQAVAEDQLVILKNVFPSQRIEAIREAATRYCQATPESNPPIDEHTENFHRRDENPAGSVVKRVCRSIRSFYWNEELGGERAVFLATSIFRNNLAQLPQNFTLEGVEDGGWMTNPCIVQYPAGGGHIHRHTDPDSKNHCNILIAMSRKGVDFGTGGGYFSVGDETICYDVLLESGDVFFFKPSLAHGVDPVEPQLAPPQWAESSGRWVMMPGMIQVASLHGQKVDGLRDLQSAKL